jgi:myo-inositol-1(or 4)-monophosphatase
MSNLAEFIDFAVHLADVASREILPLFRTPVGVDNKAAGRRFDPVTMADREAEAAIRREIRRVYPDHGVMGEEHGFEEGESPYTWVIDPIDGTRAFILGQLHWGVLIALNDGVRPIVGVMRQPYTGETFVGSRLGAELRRGGRVESLTSRKATRLEDAILCATDPAMFESLEDRKRFDLVAQHARSVRYGGDCYTPCLVAAGCADLVIEMGLKPWDVQPLIPIVEGAGAVITSWSGERADTAQTMVVASNRELHARVIALLNEPRGD